METTNLCNSCTYFDGGYCGIHSTNLQGYFDAEGNGIITACSDHKETEAMGDAPGTANLNKYLEDVADLGITATPEQVASYRKIVTRYEKEADSFFVDSFKALICDFGFIVIGIETDGYAHS